MDRQRMAGVVVALLLAFSAAPTKSQENDVLIIRVSNNDDKIMRLVGQILNLTSEQVVFVAKGSTQERKFAIARVLEIAPARSEDEEMGRQRLGAAQYESAKEAFERAIAAEQANWKKAELSALIAQCDLGLGELDAAGQRMMGLVKSDPESRLLAYLPLAWIDGFKTPSAANLSAWAADASPAMKLTAASWLLSGDQRKEAISQLEKLAKNGSPRIGALAEAQIWRTKLATITPLEAQHRFERVKAFPSDLQGGPWFVAAQGASRTNQPKRAAEAFMRVALLHPMQASLAVEAQFLAAQHLQSAGANSDALALFERIAAATEDSPRRSEAIDALAKLRGAAK
jgi:tetratricopeptide (TPR) repeat protein